MKLQFKHQGFQADAAAAVCDVFQGQPLCTASYRMGQEGDQVGDVASDALQADVGFRNHPLVPELSPARLLSNLQEVQLRGGLRPSEALSGPGINLSVEMETGTGKTYTYVKTIYELNQRYGWSKFIVVVPSVAIREGVYQALKTTQECFTRDYKKPLQFFIYRSDRLTDVERFASDNGIHVMIINMQAFNSSKSQRVIDKRQDTFRSRRPIDLIAQTNPILIIDEPQSVEGRQTQEGLKKFNPLFTLRYSATHRKAYDMVYRLDAMDAYNLRLVKKIAALGVTLTGSTGTSGYVYLEGIDLDRDRPPVARVGFEVRGASGARPVVRTLRRGDDLYERSKRLDEYADRYVITEIDGRDNSVTFLNGLKLYAGQISGNEAMTALQRRIQIRETIRVHLQRERELYPKGVKVLSLFFIDEVGKYRLYDGDSDSGRSGEYAKMFEEEYTNLTAELQREIGDEAYLSYLDGIDVHQTHQGYFSIDQKRGKKARFVEKKINRRTQTSDDADAYDLIMRDKERLLSLEEPVRFVFSHSALREGWDNPNVFQICMLKPQSASEIRGRQEIGRGLRLCVNQQGERMDEEVLGDEVQELNKLTLITDLEYGTFAQALQTGLAESMAERPQKVSLQFLQGQTLRDADGAPVKVTQELAEAIYEDLVKNGYLHRGKLTEHYYEDQARGAVKVASEAESCADALTELLARVYDGSRMQPENSNAGTVTMQAEPEKLRGEAFRALWEKIRRKSFYTVSFDSQELIQNAIHKLDSALWVAPIFVKAEYGEQKGTITSREQLLQGEGFQRRRTSQERTDQVTPGGVHYDLVGKLAERTKLTRATIAAILQGMAPLKFGLFSQNPEGFIAEAEKLIRGEKAKLLLGQIQYHGMDDSFGLELFTQRQVRGREGQNAIPVKRSICSYLICDSKVELDFAKALEEHEAVELYVKLPKSFFLSTPVGRYTPDWAIVFRGADGQRRFCVAETKGSLEPGQLREVEIAKLRCAAAHFAAVSGGCVQFEAVTDLNELIGRMF